MLFPMQNGDAAAFGVDSYICNQQRGTALF